MHRATIPVLVVTVLTVGTAIAIASSSNPPASRTGAPGESTCLSCHSTYALNVTGSVELIGAPSLYRAGRTYRITARVTTANTAGNANREWGFEVTAINTNDDTGAGTFANVAGQGTSITSGGGGLSSRSYVRQTDSRQSQASPAAWAFDWTAPATGNVPVMFYVVGVAGNGGNATSNDYVYTNTWAAADTTTPVRSTTWGEVKAQYLK